MAPLVKAFVALFAVFAWFAPPNERDYWVSARVLSTDDETRLEAVLRDGLPLRIDDPQDPPTPALAAVPGVVVGRVTGIETAMEWVARVCFPGLAKGLPDDPTALLEQPAPLPWSGLGSEAVLAAVFITGAAGSHGTRTIGWPSDPGRLLPEGSKWVPATLVPTRAPLFPVPSAHYPVAARRFRVIGPKADVFVLGLVDRCDGEASARVCSRWAQVVAREGSRFTPGYLPGYQVVPRGEWIRAEGATQALPKAALLVRGVAGSEALFVLVVQALDGTTHRKVLRAPLVEGRLPAASTLLDKQSVVVKLEGQPKQSFPVSAALDRFERP